MSRGEEVYLVPSLVLLREPLPRQSDGARPAPGPPLTHARNHARSRTRRGSAHCLHKDMPHAALLHHTIPLTWHFSALRAHREGSHALLSSHARTAPRPVRAVHIAFFAAACCFAPSFAHFCCILLHDPIRPDDPWQVPSLAPSRCFAS